MRHGKAGDKHVTDVEGCVGITHGGHDKKDNEGLTLSVLVVGGEREKREGLSDDASRARPPSCTKRACGLGAAT